jgi:hypothetical protein
MLPSLERGHYVSPDLSGPPLITFIKTGVVYDCQS